MLIYKDFEYLIEVSNCNILFNVNFDIIWYNEVNKISEDKYVNKGKLYYTYIDECKKNSLTQVMKDTYDYIFQEYSI